MTYSPSETVRLSSWELACIEYALLSAASEEVQRKDIASGTITALKKLQRMIAAAEQQLRSRSDKNLMNYSAVLSPECAAGSEVYEKTGD